MRFLSDLLACLRFYSRLPVPVLSWETQPHAMLDFAKAIRALPLAGLIIALPAAGLLYGAGKILPPELAAGLALSLFVLTTGAFHEDGLADTADGFGGGRSIERKLEIMRDSRIGTFGGVALGLSLLARWAALTALLRMGLTPALVALFAAAALSRWLGLLPIALLPPARKDGAAHAAVGPEPGAMALGGALALGAGLAPWWLGGGALWLSATAVALACGAALGMVYVSHRQIRGQTGDVAGAAQQVAEITFLIALCIRI
jgi:adenosylcobinamide-GDP ribazoletransferase